MSRYFDLEKLKEMIEAKAETVLPEHKSALLYISNWFNHLPAADVEPVRHGHWILTQKISENAFRYNCSECNRWVQDGAGKNPSDRFPYCHCGAKMDGKKNEPKEKKCGDCAKFEGCKEYTTSEEMFPEVGGCKAFERKENTDADTV